MNLFYFFMVATDGLLHDVAGGASGFERLASLPAMAVVAVVGGSFDFVFN